MSIINLKTALGSGSGGGWAIGETRRLAIDPDISRPFSGGIRVAVPFEYDGLVLLDRENQSSVLGAQYPTFYQRSAGFYGVQFLTTRTPGAASIYSLDSNGLTIIAVGLEGATWRLYRSTDGGVTWSMTTIGNPVNQPLYKVFYSDNLDKWFIYSSPNSGFVSTNDGSSWATQAFVGLPVTFSTAYDDNLRVKELASSHIVMAFDDGLYSSADGVNWTARTLPGNVAGVGGKLTTGNNWLVIITENFQVYRSPDGATWTSSGVIAPTTGGGSSTGNVYRNSYGVVYTGIRWIYGLGGRYSSYIDSGVHVSNPAPAPSGSHNGWSGRMYAYTADGTPNGFSFANWNYAGGAVTDWGYTAGGNWNSRVELDGFYSGPSEVAGSWLMRDGQFGGAFNMFNRNVWEDMIASANKRTHNQTSLAIIGVNDYIGDGINGEVTRDGRTWLRSGAASIRLSGGTELSLTLPGIAGSAAVDGYGHGTAFTRIA